ESSILVSSRAPPISSKLSVVREKRVVLERWMAAICWVLQELIERGGTRPRSSRW
uniref:Uncharacterized protein n=1 Tax=Aegilops tauschii subsp. strangulata TaxID=200361 RepID=A0A453B6C7_AEGTS